jgi:hypothetical protein
LAHIFPHLRTELAHLKHRYAQATASRHRFSFYAYLAAVYDLYRRFRRRKVAREAARRVATLFHTGSPAAAHPLRVLLDATATADSKTKSRWTLALRYAWRQRHAWTDFGTFVADHGGIAGCARKWASLRPGPPRGFVMVGGPDRRPRIPLYIDKRLLAADGSWPHWTKPTGS